MENKTKTKARIILTERCPRKCPYCANQYPNIRAQIKPFPGYKYFHNHTEVIITGGEPMLFPDLVEAFVRETRLVNSKCAVYLYTAIYKEDHRKMYELFDGIQYTVHQPVVKKDIRMFEGVQEALKYHPGSCRLSLASDIDFPLNIVPSVWSAIKVKAFKGEETCIVPVDEELFILSDMWIGK